MERIDLQKELDLKKWYLSEEHAEDMCGSFDYCEFCNKQGETPCADACYRKEESERVPEAETTDTFEEAYTESTKKTDKAVAKVSKKKRVVKSFEEKFAESSDTLKARYYELVKEFCSYLDVKSRISKRCDSYRASRSMLGRIFITGKSLKVNFPLDVNKHKDYPHTDSSSQKSLADTPFRFKVSSGLAVRRAKKLIAIVAAEVGVEKRKYRKEVGNRFIKK